MKIPASNLRICWENDDSCKNDECHAQKVTQKKHQQITNELSVVKLTETLDIFTPAIISRSQIRPIGWIYCR